jgi:hypothetical protein
MVGGPITGAFLLSSFTATIGNGCRSGSYSIFLILVFAAATFEALAWWQLPKHTPNSLRHRANPQSAFRSALSLLRNTLQIRPSQTCRSGNSPRDGACQHSVVMLHYSRPNAQVVQSLLLPRVYLRRRRLGIFPFSFSLVSQSHLKPITDVLSTDTSPSNPHSFPKNTESVYIGPSAPPSH